MSKLAEPHNRMQLTKPAFSHSAAGSPLVSAAERGRPATSALLIGSSFIGECRAFAARTGSGTVWRLRGPRKHGTPRPLSLLPALNGTIPGSGQLLPQLNR